MRYLKAINQLGFLKLPIKHLPFVRDAAQEEERRVLMLFQNRAQLKKSYGALQDEIYRLKDRIKQQEGATQRVQSMLSTLEERLGAQDSGYPALVFYQLRALWRTGREIISEFSADLARQQEERERRAHLADYNRRQFAHRTSLENQLRAAEAGAFLCHGKLKELQERREQLTRFWHYFKRRQIDARLRAVRAEVNAADLALGSARVAVEELEKVPPPEFPGLSIEARRAINLAAIAYAEVLCARLSPTALVVLARDANAHREVHDDYGGRKECERLMAQIAQARAALQARNSHAQDVKECRERLKQIVRYRHGADTVPAPESLAVAPGMPNVLIDDTWDLFRVLLR